MLLAIAKTNTENFKFNSSNNCSMRLLEILIVVIAMLVPFAAIKSADLTTFAYWNIVAAAYLAYIAIRRWEVE